MQPSGVSIHFVNDLLRGMADRGIEVEPLLRQSGIDPTWLAEPAVRVTAAAYAALLRSLALALGDEFFGRDSRPMKPGSFAMLCHAVISCKILRQALSRALRFYGLLLDDIGGTLREQGGELVLALQPTHADRIPEPLAYDMLLLFLHRLGCWLVNRRIPVNAVGFAIPRPRHADEYRLIFSTDPLFDQACSFLAFDMRYGELPVVRDEAALKAFLAAIPENLFVRYRPSHGTLHLVRRHLAAMNLADWPRFAVLARSLGMSASTLHRRLAAEGSSFQAIKDQIRRERAISLLRQTDGSVMTIAEELGFAEASAFHRAFRKWSGSTPGQVRREPVE